MLDLTVNLGNILTILSFVVVGASIAASIRSQVTTMAIRLLSLETEIKKLSEVLIALGRQDERLNAMDARLISLEHDFRDLRRGKGFILNNEQT
jgi:hypothetical protein